MEIRYTVDFDFADDLWRALDSALTDMSPVMRSIGEALMISTKDRFPTGLSPEGTPWAPKTQTTIDAQNRREGYQTHDFRPLFGPSGDLRTILDSGYGPHEVFWGSNRPYAGVMQYGAKKGQFGTASNGSPIPWGDIPARPFVGLSPADEAMIIDDLDEWLQDAVDK